VRDVITTKDNEDFWSLQLKEKSVAEKKGKNICCNNNTVFIVQFRVSAGIKGPVRSKPLSLNVTAPLQRRSKQSSRSFQYPDSSFCSVPTKSRTNITYALLKWINPLEMFGHLHKITITIRRTASASVV
jgi:hypothetical protein